MKISKASACSVAAMLATTGVAPAAAQRAPVAVKHSVMSLDVAGARLGMPLGEAKAAISTTYRCEEFGQTATFAEQVDEEARKRRGESVWGHENTGVWQLICKGSAGEYMRVDVAHTQAGPVVDRIDLAIPMAGQERAAFQRQVTTKYGRPTVGGVTTGAWCDAGIRCGDAIVFSESPELVVNTLGDTAKIMATRGKRAQSADAAAVATAADRVAPKRSGAAF